MILVTADKKRLEVELDAAGKVIEETELKVEDSEEEIALDKLPEAVVKAVKSALLYFVGHRAGLLALPPTAPNPEN